MRPNKITILRSDGRCGFHVFVGTYMDDVQCVDNLVYDEMLGMVARLLCPENETARWMIGKPLFLGPPEEPPHPDVNGERPPDCVTEGRDDRTPTRGEYDRLVDLLAQREREVEALKNQLPHPCGPEHYEQAAGRAIRPVDHSTDIFTGRRCTDYHWQVMRRNKDGNLLALWNVYPTSKKRKVISDPNISTGKLVPNWHYTSDMTLAECVDTVRDACATKRTPLPDAVEYGTAADGVDHGITTF
jgi:hypothetical protein